YPPTIFGVLLLIIVICLVFAGLTFFLDRFRFPFLLFFAFATYVLWLPEGWDHFYAVNRAAHKQGPYPADVLSAKGRTHQGSLIVVCANGGGIQGSAWTAKVLTELDRPSPLYRSRPYVAFVRGFQMRAATLVQFRCVHLYPAPDATRVHRNAPFRQ